MAHRATAPDAPAVASEPHRRIVYTAPGTVFSEAPAAATTAGSAPPTRLPGSLSLCEEAGRPFLHWEPQSESTPGVGALPMHVDFLRIKSLRADRDRLYIEQTDGTQLFPLVFGRGANELKRFRTTCHRKGYLESRSASTSDDVIDMVTHAAAFFSSRLTTRLTSLMSAAHNQPTVRNRVTFRPDDDMEDDSEGTDGVISTQPELVVRQLESAGELGDFDVLEDESILPERPECTRTASVTLERLREHLPSSTAAVVDEGGLREAVFHGGLTPEARPEAWGYFLGYRCPPERDPAEFRKEHVEKYEALKSQWKSVLPEQLKRNRQLSELFLSVDKDVPRTDRSMPMFVDSNGPGLKMLHDILMTYGIYNFNLGYVQGMSDLVSVLLHVFQDEVDTFWCFAHWMDELESIFTLQQPGLLNKLAALGVLVRFVEPNLMAHLEDEDSAHLLFCFQWLLVCFKREFAWDDVLVMWDVLFSKYLSEDFTVFVCTAMIGDLRAPIMEGNLKNDEILHLSNDKSCRHGLNDVLAAAEGIFKQVKAAQGPPEVLRPLLLTWPEREESVQAQAEYDAHERDLAERRRHATLLAEEEHHDAS